MAFCLSRRAAWLAELHSPNSFQIVWQKRGPAPRFAGNLQGGHDAPVKRYIRISGIRAAGWILAGTGQAGSEGQIRRGEGRRSTGAGCAARGGAAGGKSSDTKL